MDTPKEPMTPNNLLPIKQKLYEIYKIKEEEGTHKDVVAKQSLGIAVTKAIARDKPIIVFQQQNIVLQHIYGNVAEALQMLDELDPDVMDITPTVEDEGEKAFISLAEFCMLCFKRKASWKEYKAIVLEAYMRTTIKNSRTWTEAAGRLGIQRSAIHVMATRMGITDKPLDRRDKE